MPYSKKQAPRTLDDLPFAGELGVPAGDGELEEDGDYDRVRFDKSTFDDPGAAGARFLEVAFTDVTFDTGWLRRSRLSQVWLEQSRFVGTDLAEASLTDVWLQGCVL